MENVFAALEREELIFFNSLLNCSTELVQQQQKNSQITSTLLLASYLPEVFFYFHIKLTLKYTFLQSHFRSANYTTYIGRRNNFE